MRQDVPLCRRARRNRHVLAFTINESGAYDIGVAFKRLVEQDPEAIKEDAAARMDMLAEIPTLVGPIAMQNAMGATKMELIALEEEGLLAPRSRISSVKNVWRISDGEALVAKLRTRAVTVAADNPDWDTLLLTRKRMGVSLVKMVAAVEADALAVGTRQGVEGFHGIVVRVEQIAQLTALKERPDPTEGGKLQSAAAYGRSVGLRDNGTFVALIEADYVQAKARLHPGTKRMQYWMDEADVAAFSARFATPTMLITETGLHRNTIYRLLDAARVAPFSKDGQDFGAVSVLLRSDLAEIPQFSSAA